MEKRTSWRELVIPYEQARERFPDAFTALEEEIGGEFKLDPAGRDVFYVNDDGELIFGNTLDDLWDKWDPEAGRWEGL